MLKIPTSRGLLRWGLAAAAVLLIALQFVPYGRAHADPPVRREPTWDSQRTRDLAVRACYACHSNETEWPWYSSLAPVSWLVQRDVEAGRRKLNFSEFDRPQRDAGNAVEQVEKGEMPLSYYAWLHPEASLTSAERQDLLRGLEATFGRKH